jgi:hypothetical protein
MTGVEQGDLSDLLAVYKPIPGGEGPEEVIQIPDAVQVKVGVFSQEGVYVFFML